MKNDVAAINGQLLEQKQHIYFLENEINEINNEFFNEKNGLLDNIKELEQQLQKNKEELNSIYTNLSGEQKQQKIIK